MTASFDDIIKADCRKNCSSLPKNKNTDIQN